LPSVDENGERMYLINEVGVWILMLQLFEETERFENDPARTDFRKWLIELRERALRG
jgi:hypothetical protein